MGLWPSLDGDVVLLLHALDQLVDQLIKLAVLCHLLDPLLHLAVEKIACLQGLAQCLAQVLQGVLAIEFGEARKWILKAGIEQILRQCLEQVFHAHLRGWIAGVFGVANSFHILEGPR